MIQKWAKASPRHFSAWGGAQSASLDYVVKLEDKGNIAGP